MFEPRLLFLPAVLPVQSRCPAIRQTSHLSPLHSCYYPFSLALTLHSYPTNKTYHWPEHHQHPIVQVSVSLISINSSVHSRVTTWSKDCVPSALLLISSLMSASNSPPGIPVNAYYMGEKFIIFAFNCSKIILLGRFLRQESFITLQSGAPVCLEIIAGLIIRHWPYFHDPVVQSSEPSLPIQR